MEALRALGPLLAAVPLRWCLVGAGVVALGAQAWLMREAVRRRAQQRRLRIAAEAGDWDGVRGAAVPRPYAEILSVLALLMLPLVTAMSVQRARALTVASAAERDPAAAARLLSDGARGQLGSTALGIVLEELAGELGVVAWSFAFVARRQLAGLIHGARVASRDAAEADAWARHPSLTTETVLACAGAGAVLVILPVLHGAFSSCMILYNRVAALAAAAPAEQLRAFAGALPRARRALDSGIAAGKVGLVLTAVSAAALLFARWPARARRRRLGRAERGGRLRLASAGDALWCALVSVLVSLTLYVATRPPR